MQHSVNHTETRTGLWQSEGPNWSYWLGIVLSGRWFIVGGAIIGLALGLVMSKLPPNIYQSDALLQFESNKTMNATVDLVSVIEDQSAAEEIDIMRSRMVLGMAVQELGFDLVVAPRRLPFIGDWVTRGSTPGVIGRTPWFGLSRFAWGGEVIEVARLDTPEVWQYAGFQGVVSDQSGRFDLQLPDGVWARNLPVGKPVKLDTAVGEVRLFVRQLVARPGLHFYLRREPMDLATNRLRNGLTISARESGLIDLVYSALSPEEAQRILNGVAINYLRQSVERRSAEADQTLAFMEEQLPLMKADLEKAEGRFNQFRVSNRTFDVTAEGNAMLQASVELDAAIGALEQRRRELLQRVTNEHPSVQAIASQIQALQSRSGQANSKFRQFPDLERQMLQMMRDVRVKNELYNEMLNAAQQLKVARAGTLGNARIVDSASLPRGPSAPNRQLILLTYVLAGLAIGVGIVLLRQFAKPGVRDAKVLEQTLGLPVYATVPRFEAPKGSKDDALLVSLRDGQDPTVESIRSLRTALLFANLDARNNIILMTGPSPALGKSFITSNLAVVMAQSGKRVLVIDADMRRGHLHDAFGVKNRDFGLSEYLAGQIAIDQAVQPTNVGDLYFVTTGAIPPNPSELLLHPRFDALLQWADREYDHVLVDAGPLLAVTDAAIIGRTAGCTLLVCRYEVTPLREMELAMQRLQQAGAVLRGIVFNDMLKHGAYGYGYGYGYQYTYSYRNDDKNDVKKEPKA